VPVTVVVFDSLVVGGLMTWAGAGANTARMQRLSRQGLCFACEGRGRTTVTYPNDTTCRACNGTGRRLGF
jgi:DnaJ-class molecular chaperone